MEISDKMMNNITTDLNNSKELFLKTMVSEGQITKEQQQKMNQYSLFVTRKSLLGKIWDKLIFKGDDDDLTIRIVVAKIFN
tara:strand:- start:104 stop:346 length:243 start_codon:yes stop_codon:yes gene_type:complete